MVDTKDIAAGYDRVAYIYDEHFATPQSQAQDREVIDAVCARFGAMLRTCDVLDVGCGTGWAIDAFDIAPARYVGVDVSAGMVSRARLKFGAHSFAVGSLEIATLLAKRDLVLCMWGVLNHVPDEDEHEPEPYYLDNAVSQLARAGRHVVALVACEPESFLVSMGFEAHDEACLGRAFNACFAEYHIARLRLAPRWALCFGSH